MLLGKTNLNIVKIFVNREGKNVIFDDYDKTGKIYHIIAMYDLKSTLEKGIKYNDKVTYNTKYKGFHSLVESGRTEGIPDWVIRKKAIFASMNYEDSFAFHPNSIVLSCIIDPKKCWIANEDLANQIYAPFFMKDIEAYEEEAKVYLEGKGKALLRKYWDTSLSFEENLTQRLDRNENYNEEVMIFHDISPQNIEIEFLVSGHEILRPKEWKKKYC